MGGRVAEATPIVAAQAGVWKGEYVHLDTYRPRA
jgi:hypothetical protein